MATNDATHPEAYFETLEPARARELRRVRDVINAAMPAGYVERMAWGMIAWEVPLELSGRTYNKQPLVYAALAAQKNYSALYLNGVYTTPEHADRLKQAFAASGKKLDMGKSCIRFRTADDLALDAIAAEVASVTPSDYATIHRAAHHR